MEIKHIEEELVQMAQQEKQKKLEEGYLSNWKEVGSHYHIHQTSESSNWSQLYSQGSLDPEMENMFRTLTKYKEEQQKTADQQLALFDDIHKEARALFFQKNLEYDNAIVKTGVVGAVTAMTGDMARLRAMVLRSADHGRGTEQNVRDKAQDVLIQAAICIMMIDSENFEGKD